MNDTEQKHWLVRPETIRWLWRGGIVMLAIVALSDFFIHRD